MRFCFGLALSNKMLNLSYKIPCLTVGMAASLTSSGATTKGQGQLNVYANDLTSGTYSYTLVIDGSVVATQRMIKQ